MQLLISPHSDDATLFASYTILRNKPLVITVTHSTLQGDNGNERIVEDYEAMRTLGVPVCFLGIDEDKLTKAILREKLAPFITNDTVYIPEYELDGNPHHNLIHRVAKELFPNTKEYKTYSGLEDRTVGKEIVPTLEELELKKKAMSYYKTQIENLNTAHYFNATTEYE